ncbi:ribokinase [Sporosarcina sp. Marseille-Q4063]|uniref:ribokinase n=1 Tax=Sporosarcina sp. Marseille-Q4063 TaxID=2810514 RepID=UPI001BAF3712|nr:ribokinase [Sporosarcina sp. Marseille-Q4063]QUW23048.1 ribokinase [Sporosarcina sp. Marseille-Q4063]
MITVIGSLNMDLVVETKGLPKQGETNFGKSFATMPGGKGANQAVSVSRLGADVQFIGCIGEDLFGNELLKNLKNENIDTKNIQTVKNSSTGIANILLSEGDNRIIVIPGANYELTSQKIISKKDTILQSKMVIIQLEIPANTVLKVLEICHTANIPVLLNPAPASSFSMDYIDYATFITPNETECKDIFGVNYEKALELYPNQLIVTKGKSGAQYFDGIEHKFIKGFKTNVIDTTGAGDTFNGAFAFAISRQYPFNDAVEFANAAASLSVEKFGAQGGMPSLQLVMKRVASRI